MTESTTFKMRSYRQGKKLFCVLEKLMHLDKLKGLSLYKNRLTIVTENKKEENDG